MVGKKSDLPTLFVEADTIPQAHYRATKEVWDKGMSIRTQYDRKDHDGKFIDPPSKDATVVIAISNPFNQPRYPVISFVERGAYIAEMLGAKDHFVVDYQTLKSGKWGEGQEAKQWPYHYHQRLFAHPTADGRKIDQIGGALERLAKDLVSRRAVATTRLPDVDVGLKEDIPCLGEVHFRATEDGADVDLHMRTYWRSRDLFKAWPDNVVALTFLQQVAARDLGKMIGRNVRVGSYTDVSSSLHIYGQDINERNVAKYVESGEEKIVSRAWTSETAAEGLVIPEMEELITPRKIEEWQFPPETVQMIRGVIDDIKDGKLIA